jgi:membrane-associated phospholipid phosphatase
MQKLIIIFFILNSTIGLTQSPYNLDWKREVAIFGLGIGSAGFGYLTNSNIEPLTLTQINALDRNTIHPFDRATVNNHEAWANDISNVGVFSLMASPLVLFTSKSVQKDWTTIAVMYAEVLGLGTTLPNLTKNTVQRIRPFVYNPDVDLAHKMEIDAQRSFFSGHTCAAFLSAIFVSTVYSTYYPNSKWKPIIWTCSLLAASTVGYMRYQSGNHFPTDILVGAAVGSGIGYLVPILHKQKGFTKLSVIPSFGEGTFGVNIGYKL